MGAQVPCGTGRDTKKEKEANPQSARERRHPAPQLEAATLCGSGLLLMVLRVDCLTHGKRNKLGERSKIDGGGEGGGGG